MQSSGCELSVVSSCAYICLLHQRLTYWPLDAIMSRLSRHHQQQQPM